MRWNDCNPDEMALAQLLAQACRLAKWRLRVHIEKVGIHSGQAQVLAHLDGHDNVPQSKIARAMNASPAAMTSILQRMERDGWITRARDTSDQRMVRICLTEKAKECERKIKNSFVEIDEEISSIYTQEERADLRRLLLKLNKHFSKDDGSSTDTGTDSRRRKI